MVSYFQNGITDIHPSKDLDLPQLVKLIRSNPLKDQIEVIRSLRVNGDKNYKKLKRQLPYVTPNCAVKVRSLDQGEIQKNLISFSQYLYIDIDVDGDVEQYKRYFITKYGHLALLVCKSCSGGGISVLFRITNTITVDNFEDIRQKVITTILKNEPIDPNAQGIGRAMFISSDPDVWINYDNEIEVDLTTNDTDETKKEVNQCNSWGVYKNTLVYPFSRISYDEFIKSLRFETEVVVVNPVLDFKPVNFTKVFVPKVIKDGAKHKLYSRIIHTLVFLNPDIEKDNILSYLFFINNNFAKPRMDSRELTRLFHSVYNGITNTGVIHVKAKVKNVHFNPSCGLDMSQRTQIANYLNGAQRRSVTIDKIQDAIQSIVQMGRKVTQKEVARITGLCLKTVRTHFHADRIDMYQVVEEINSGFIPKMDEQVTDGQTNFNDLFYNIGLQSIFDPLELIEMTRSTQNENSDHLHLLLGTRELRRSG